MVDKDLNKEYIEFSEKYPSYSKDIVSYERGYGDSLKFKLKNGKTAWYFPLKKKQGKKCN